MIDEQSLSIHAIFWLLDDCTYALMKTNPVDTN